MNINGNRPDGISLWELREIHDEYKIGKRIVNECINIENDHKKYLALKKKNRMKNIQIGYWPKAVKKHPVKDFFKNLSKKILKFKK